MKLNALTAGLLCPTLPLNYCVDAAINAVDGRAHVGTELSDAIETAVGLGWHGERLDRLMASAVWNYYDVQECVAHYAGAVGLRRVDALTMIDNCRTDEESWPHKARGMLTILAKTGDDSWSGVRRFAQQGVDWLAAFDREQLGLKETDNV